MKNLPLYVSCLLVFLPFKVLRAQSENDIYDLVSSNVGAAFTLHPGNCLQQKYFLKSLYFVDQQEDRTRPSLTVGCKHFEMMIQPLVKLELKLRKQLRTHFHLKNLNFVVADVLKNALFDHSVSALMVPWLS